MSISSVIDKIRKFLGTESLDVYCDMLVGQYLSKEQINYLPMFDWMTSTITIMDNGIPYLVGLRRKEFDLVRIDISDTSKVFPLYMDDNKKCEFLVKHIKEVEDSIREISERLQVLVDKSIKDEVCKERYMKRLKKLIMDRL